MKGMTMRTTKWISQERLAYWKGELIGLGLIAMVLGLAVVAVLWIWAVLVFASSVI